MIGYAFKEWAVICQALAEGRQSLILRKGGIAEEGGVFRPEHSRFWLFPTQFHQQGEGIKPEALPLLKTAQANQPPVGSVRLSHFVEVTGAFFVPRLDIAESLDRLHMWSAETVQKRFVYRQPGLYVLAARVFRAVQARDVILRPADEGCKTWVELSEEPSDVGAMPVMDSRTYATFLDDLDTLLHPRAFA